MTSEMVERCSGRLDEYLMNRPNLPGGGTVLNTEEMVRIVIAAMRPPTQAMLRAGEIAWFEFCDAAGGDEVESQLIASNLFCPMIDAALEENPDGTQ